VAAEVDPRRAAGAALVRQGAAVAWRRVLISQIGPMLLAIMGLCVFFTLKSEFFLTENNALNIGRQIAVVAIVALGVTIAIIAGEIDLSMGSVMAVTSVGIGIVLHSPGAAASQVDVLEAVGLAVLIGLAFGLFNGCVTVFGRIPSFIVTLGTLSVGSGLALSYHQGTPDPILSDRFISWFAVGSVGPVPVLLVFAALVFALTSFLLRRTLFGIQVYATGGNPEAARLAGVPTARVKIVALTICGLFAGFAGVLGTARVGTALPQLGLGIELDAIAAAVLGGTRFSGGYGMAIGTLLGATLIGIVNNGLTLLGVASPVQSIVKGGVIIAAVLLDRIRRPG
jgi:ribose/xylose/arabinose/galactoside ABC-type transport system permease subunit